MNLEVVRRVFYAVARVFGDKTLGGVSPTYVDGVSGCFQEERSNKNERTFFCSIEGCILNLFKQNHAEQCCESRRERSK